MDKNEFEFATQQAIERIQAAYPFADLTLGPLPYGSKPRIHDGASLHLAYKPGGIVTTAPHDHIRKGQTRLTCDGQNSFVAVASGAIFDNCQVNINGDNCAIIIGPNCRLKNLRIMAANDYSMVVIGAQTSWESGAIISDSGDIVALGNDCMVSNDVIVRTSDGH